MAVLGQALDRMDRTLQGAFRCFGRHEAQVVGIQQFVDVEQLGALTGVSHEVQIVVFSVPDGFTGSDLAHIEVVVLVAFIAGIEMEDVDTQPERRQQPRLQVVELRPAGRGPGHVEAPRPPVVVHVDRAHDALRVGVGAREQVERLAFGRVDTRQHTAEQNVSVAGSRLVNADERSREEENRWLSRPNTPCWRTRNTAPSTRWCAPADGSRWSASTSPRGTSPPPSTSWSAGSGPASATSCCSAPPAPASRLLRRG